MVRSPIRARLVLRPRHARRLSLPLLLACALASGPLRAADAPAAPAGEPVALDSRRPMAVNIRGLRALADGRFVAAFGQSARAFDAFGRPLHAPVAIPEGDSRTTIALDRGGNLVAVGIQGDAQGFGVVAARFDANGQALGEVFAVNTTGAGEQRAATVAMDADGAFVVVWQSSGQDDPDGSIGIYARRYDADGVPRGGEFRVNTITAGDQTQPAVAMDAHGNFTVAWRGASAGRTGIFAQRYSAAGTPRGGELRADAPGVTNCGEPAIAMSAQGAFVIAWDRDSASATSAVDARRYTAAGVPSGAPFEVGGSGRLTDLALSARGEFAIGFGDRVRVYDAAGIAAGAALSPRALAFAGTRIGQMHIAMDADGDLLFVHRNEDDRIVDCDEFGCYVETDHLVVAERYTGYEAVNGSVILTSSAASVAPGGSRDYRLVVRNDHAAPAPTGDAALDAVLASVGDAAGLSLDLALPPNAPVTAISAGDWECTKGSTVHCLRTRPLAAGDQSALTITVSAYSEGAANVQLDSFQFDPQAGDDTSTSAGSIADGGQVVVSFTKTRTTRVEGTRGSVNVALSRPSEQTLRVPFSVGGTAGPDDISGVTATPLVFEPGKLTRTISIGARGDSIDEPNETVILTLAPAEGAVLGANRSFTYVLKDDDDPPSVAFAADRYAYPEGAVARPVLQLDRASGKTVRVQYLFESRSAKEGEDFRAPEVRSVSFAPGQRQASLAIDLIADGIDEPLEYFFVTLVDPVNAALGTRAQTKVVISDD